MPVKRNGVALSTGLAAAVGCRRSDLPAERSGTEIVWHIMTRMETEFKRVDLDGSGHNWFDTPHIHDSSKTNTGPDGVVRAGKAKGVRKASPDEEKGRLGAPSRFVPLQRSKSKGD
jgi:hypothetical protein